MAHLHVARRIDLRLQRVSDPMTMSYSPASLLLVVARRRRHRKYPTTRRFFAGGGGSVRGYGYRNHPTMP